MLDTIRWDSELIQHYNVSGPRYTSYPTAVQFSDKIHANDFIKALTQSNTHHLPLSLYIHVPFCANICYYCGCNKIITKDRNHSEQYVQALLAEIELISQHISSNQIVEQIHFGGGTPTFLTIEQITTIINTLKQHFTFAHHRECDFSIEIDPRTVDWETMGSLAELGFNRISLGVQDLNIDVQRAVNREQSLQQIQSVIDAAHTLQFYSINIDLIYGLPKQTPQSFKHTIEEIIKLQPDRLSVFNYAHLPERFKPQRRIHTEDLPTPHQKLAILQNTIEQLTRAGYRYIGMDHFALPDDDLSLAQEEGRLCRNFQGYNTHGHCALIGLGASSISQIGDLYCQNTADLEEYLTNINKQHLATKRGLLCNEDDHIRREIIQQLICHFYLDFTQIEKSFNISFRKYFNMIFPELNQMANDNLIKLNENSIEILDTGRLLVRSVCMLFDNYLNKQVMQRFSRVI